jgi:excisionase family DNA binding protein
MTIEPIRKPVMLTVAEVAASWRVSKMTVYRLIHSRELEAVQVGRSYRIDARDAAGFLRDNRTTLDLGGAA